MDQTGAEKTHSGMSPKNLARLARLRLMDDNFMSEALNGKIEAVQFILDTVLERTDLKVIRVESQYEYSSAVSRAVRLDIRAEDAEGRLADIEVQRADDPALLLRARYYAAMMDSRMLEKGSEFSMLKQRFVIFITENDPLGKGVPLYHIRNRIDELGYADAEDGGLTVLVNGAFRDETHPVGRLMHDFLCTKADDMLIPVLAQEVYYMKETEGGQEHMSSVWKEIYDEAQAEGRAEGRAVGRAEGRAENTLEIMDAMIAEGVLSDSAIARYTKTSPEQVAARRSGKPA